MRHLLIFIISCALITACGPSGKKPVKSTDYAEKARELVANGDYLAASDEYFRLAKSHKKSRILYRLRAAEALLFANETNLAEETVNGVKPGTKDNQANYFKLVLQGKIQLQRNNPEQALLILTREPDESIPVDIIAQRYLVRAQCHELLLQHLQTVKERLNYEN